MELEALRSVWKKTTSPEGYFISKDEMQHLIHKRSHLAVSEVRRKIRAKSIIAGSLGLLILVFTVYALGSEDVTVTFFGLLSNSLVKEQIPKLYLIFGFVLLFISIFHLISYRKIEEIDQNGGDLKSSISRIIEIIRKAMYVKIYSDTFVIPVTIFGFVFTFFISDDIPRPDNLTLGLVISGTFVFSVFSFFHSRRGQQKRYGDQLRTLNSCLKELEEK